MAFPDFTVDVQRPGFGLGSMALSVSEKSAQFTMRNRVNGYVQVSCLDAAYIPVAFQWAGQDATGQAGGTYTPYPIGATLIVPIYKIQSYFFKQIVGSSTVYFVCVG